MSECKQKYIEWSSENGNYCGEYDDGRLIGTDAVNEFDGWEAAWSHQQEKIDELAKHVACIKTIVSECDENTDSSWILGNIDGFIECMENILNDQSN